MNSLPVTVYTPSSALTRPGNLMVQMFSDLWRGRELAWRLFVRDTAALYRQSILGYVWAFLPPLATAGTFIFLIDALNSPLRAVVANKIMLVKINFPREALIMAGMLDVLLNFCIRLILLIPVFLIFKVPISSSILLFPVGSVALILVGLCFGLLLTPIALLYTDIDRSLTTITTFWLFLTPVIYPPVKTGVAAYFTTINPVSPVILTARDWLISQPALHVDGFLIVTTLALLLLLVAWLIYRVALPHLIERMGG
jgi:lipopolysaccharide transport system permease protein